MIFLQTLILSGINSSMVNKCLSIETVYTSVIDIGYTYTAVTNGNASVQRICMLSYVELLSFIFNERNCEDSNLAPSLQKYQ